MGQPHFTFKQFEIMQDRCAMKVGTDSIVLGSWVPVQGCRRILDIGTGTGILALMLAQRTLHETDIDGVELDVDAAEQARDNVNLSPWRERIRIIQHDILTYQAPRYDLIVSNPPYFLHGQVLPDASRQRARHTGDLDHQGLLDSAGRLLEPDGHLALILPVDIAAEFEALAQRCGWWTEQRCYVVTKRGKQPNLTLLLCQRRQIVTGADAESDHPPIENSLCLREADNQYSDEFIALADAFYLKMK